MLLGGKPPLSQNPVHDLPPLSQNPMHDLAAHSVVGHASFPSLVYPVLENQQIPAGNLQ